MYYIVINGKPFKAFKTLANAWLECFEQGFVEARGRHRPGTTARMQRHRLRAGVHVLDGRDHPFKRNELLVAKKWAKKKKYKPANWIDAL